MLKQATSSLFALLALAFMTFSGGEAQALPFVDTGLKIGYGNSMPSDEIDGLEISNFALGAAARADLAMLQVEFNVLYFKQTAKYSLAGSESSVDSDFISLPLIVRFDFSPIPVLKLAAGLGYETRISLEDTDGETQFNYVPLSITGDFKIPVIGSAGVEVRYSYMLDDPAGGKVNDLMFFGQVLF